ncbi:MAG: hypothetical protein ACE37B_10940 [Ilumatobacter sp.]|uniref:hypothetical protein n=1 Tax=Ilumatobacter sp. TaxID=1967498 RepID=UPI00391CDAE7
MRESDYYPRVARWAKDQLGCFHTAIDSGLKRGRIDVVGLRDVGGNLSGRSEVVSIEVKHGKQPFATAVGQASGYSIYADRCYLAEARPKPFDDDEIAIASRLGVGLVHVTGTQRIRVTEVVTAPVREPLEGLRLELLDKLGFSQCTLCSTLFARGDKKSWGKNIVRQSERGTHIPRALDTDQGVMYWLHEQAARSSAPDETIYHRRYLCPDCVYALFAHVDRA